MMYARLAPNATRVHRAPVGDVTGCGKHVPQKRSPTTMFGRNGPLYRTSKRVYQAHPCVECNAPAITRLARKAA